MYRIMIIPFITYSMWVILLYVWPNKCACVRMCVNDRKIQGTKDIHIYTERERVSRREKNSCCKQYKHVCMIPFETKIKRIKCQSSPNCWLFGFLVSRSFLSLSPSFSFRFILFSRLCSSVIPPKTTICTIRIIRRACTICILSSGILDVWTVVYSQIVNFVKPLSFFVFHRVHVCVWMLNMSFFPLFLFVIFVSLTLKYTHCKWTK